MKNGAKRFVPFLFLVSRCPSHKRWVRIVFFAVFQRLSIADAKHLATSGTEDGIGSCGVPFLGLAVANVDIGAAFGQTGKFEAAALRVDDEVRMGWSQYLINICVYLGCAVGSAD